MPIFFFFFFFFFFFLELQAFARGTSFNRNIVLCRSVTLPTLYAHVRTSSLPLSHDNSTARMWRYRLPREVFLFFSFSLFLRASGCHSAAVVAFVLLNSSPLKKNGEGAGKKRKRLHRHLPLSLLKHSYDHIFDLAEFLLLRTSQPFSQSLLPSSLPLFSPAFFFSLLLFRSIS
uniref:Secreted protein n=1 Tax=Trypanosoma vivax (strain Y486) TaxID=1055687 RepID=G0U5S2_TRYVY|nr:hypothetical protein TVY486_1002760 [Trypanosoma vivax Y486]